MPSPSSGSAIAVFDIDGVIRDVSGSYRRALADTVEHFTVAAYRPTSEDIDQLKNEGCWNNDWEGSQELIYRYFEAQGQARSQVALSYDELVNFFQQRYRGSDLANPDRWDGYIAQEPILVEHTYFEQLSQNQIAWGFFSGATQGSARYILERRIGLVQPVLVAMEDAPGKPDPSGLLTAVSQLEHQLGLADGLPVLYAGDTVADMKTVKAAEKQQGDRRWIAVGILPPHMQQSTDYAVAYQKQLQVAGAEIVLQAINQLTAAQIHQLI
ncbi:MAG: TIGR01548 family HAD-type hydrolase [Leptolyngbyaceae cyanobacterium SM1_1_3]|nr:TIGR01548 family HAD-type hydrolase [Leptolyngbyaceae cyanobacterium SM1_1_3]NJN02088.1 TIGR01548 family HAD-type hydrolase [Leptolyngbyaceae cyanobacterium RM1_1_2]